MDEIGSFFHEIPYLTPPKMAGDAKECNDGEYGEIAMWRHLVDRSLAEIKRIEAATAQIEGGGQSMLALASFIDQYDAQYAGVKVPRWSCKPDGVGLQRMVELNRRKVEESSERAITAINRLMQSFSEAVARLSEPISTLEKLRIKFESDIHLPKDIETQFSRAYEAFFAAYSDCARYDLKPYSIRSTSWNPSGDQQQVIRLRDYATSMMPFKEIDRLRLEYASRGIAVPAPHEFTQGKRSVHFSNEALTQGRHYSWAVLPDELLARIDSVADAKIRAGLWVGGDAGPRCDITCAYRDPLANEDAGGSGSSHHLYGKAVDFRVFDLNGDGIRDEANDWLPLKRLAVEASKPTWVEPFNESEPHLHLQWGSFAADDVGG
jgi:hypothetical protein